MSLGQGQINGVAKAEALEQITSTSTEPQKLLRAIKDATENIRFEITGSEAALRREEGVGLVENISLKQVMEELLFQMKTMNANIGGLRSELRESLKFHEASSKLQVTKEGDPAAKDNMYPVIEIKFPDKLSWNNFWMLEASRMLQHLRIPVNGKSLKGINLSALAKSSPRPLTDVNDWKSPYIRYRKAHTAQEINFCQKQLKALFPLLDLRKPLIIELSNYLDFNLRDPKLLFVNGGSLWGNVSTINPGTTEAICFYAANNDREIRGLCAYDIDTMDLRLIVRFEYFFSFPFRKWDFHFGLAFVPVNVPIDATAFKKEVPLVSTTEFNFDKDSSFKSINSQNVLATGAMSTENEADAVVLRIRILKHGLQGSVPLGWRSVNDGYTFQGPSFNRDITLAWTNGCVVEIENRLNVQLEQFQFHIASGEQYVLLPPVITSFAREMFYISDMLSTQGMISYKIENTDLRIGAVFWTLLGCNRFSVGFISSDAGTDAQTMNNLTFGNHWKTRPYIFASAREGKQILDYRNLRITATMTTDPKADLKIIISAF